MDQPFSNELHIRTGLAESYLTLPSDDVALPRTAVHDGVGHILYLKPETGLGFQNLTNQHKESRYTSQFLAVEEPTHETDQQRRRTEWRSVRRLFPNRRPQQMAFCSAVAQQRFCSAFCWAAACSDAVPAASGPSRHSPRRRAGRHGGGGRRGAAAADDWGGVPRWLPRERPAGARRSREVRRASGARFPMPRGSRSDCTGRRRARLRCATGAPCRPRRPPPHARSGRGGVRQRGGLRPTSEQRTLEREPERESRSRSP